MLTIYTFYAKISPRFRRRRLNRFVETLRPRAVDRIVDLGGTVDTWIDPSREGAGPSPAQITIVNPDRAVGPRVEAAGLRFEVGDACALPYADNAFDIGFSNSAIEHVGTWERQQRFAAEARRVASRLWIQTPAREFFIEPHLIAPAIHWLPVRWQRRLIRHFTLRGWFERPTQEDVEAFLREVRLLTYREMQTLFPDCTILRERVLGLTKSYIAVRHPEPRT